MLVIMGSIAKKTMRSMLTMLIAVTKKMMKMMKVIHWKTSS